MASDYSDIKFTAKEGVAEITLNRPEVMNAFSSQMGKELEEIYRICDSDDDIRAVVLTGEGRAFCAGADFSRGTDVFDTPKDKPAFKSDPFDFHAWDVRKPVIAAVNGHAVGIGLTISLQCDIRIMAKGAKFGLVQNRRGVFPDLRSHWTLPRAIGFSRAAELMLTGRTFDAQEAVDFGMASHALEPEEVIKKAREMAADIAVNVSPLSAALCKQLLWQSPAPDSDAANEAERLNHILLMGKNDAKEGIMAWMEKRPPNWQSRTARDWPETRE